MKYFVFLVFSFFCLFAFNHTNAENYAVDVPVLNIRSCASTDCDIIGKLSQDDIVFVENDADDWIEIKTDDGTGFVIRSALRTDNTLYSIFGVLMLLIILLAIWFIPSIVASGNKNSSKIFWMNLLLGWFPIVWLILLLAALLGEREDKI